MKPFSDSLDSDTVIEILNQSVMNDWQGLFPLKDGHKKIGQKVSGSYDWNKIQEDLWHGKKRMYRQELTRARKLRKIPGGRRGILHFVPPVSNLRKDQEEPLEENEICYTGFPEWRIVGEKNLKELDAVIVDNVPKMVV